MKSGCWILVTGCLLIISNFADAQDVRGINIDFVNIGHSGNAADVTGFGAVNYDYRIGQYEITNTQWNTFVSAAGEPTGGDSRAYDNRSQWIGAQQPANRISWLEAAQFCNWLTSGDKSKGAYQFSGTNAIAGDFLGIDRATAISLYGSVYVIPSEDEWFKAAYFKPDASGYSVYTNGTNTVPLKTESRYGSPTSGPWNIGSGRQEQNGTYDMIGNVREWDEALIPNPYYPGTVFRGTRGGSYGSTNGQFASGYRPFGDQPSDDYGDSGFRVAAIPEPGTIGLLALGGIFLRSRKSFKS